MMRGKGLTCLAASILCIAVGTAICAPSATLAQSSFASDYCFDSTNDPCIQPVRPDRFKSLILEFIDTEQSTVGHTLGRLVWREIRELTTDIRGTVVVLVHNQSNFGAVSTSNPLLSSELDGTYPAEFVTSEMLRSKGHIAANLIGQQSTAEIVIWGNALSIGEAVLVQLNMTLPSINPNRTWTNVTFSGGAAEFSFPVPSERLNFPENTVLRTELFEREFMVRCNRATNCPSGIELRAGPSQSSTVVSRIDRGVQVSVSDAVNQWLFVETAEVSGYMNIYHVELTPANLVFSDAKVTGLSAPRSDSEPIFSQIVSGVYPVNRIVKDVDSFENEHIANNWYEISVSDTNFWVQGSRNEYGPSMPSSLFVAALYRFQDGQYRQVEDLIQRYMAAENQSDPKVMAAAHRFAALSNYLGRKQGPAQELTYVNLAIEHARQATEFLPFDPAGHVLLGAILTSEGQFEDGILSVIEAKNLNEFDTYLLEFLDAYCPSILEVGLVPELCTA